MAPSAPPVNPLRRRIALAAALVALGVLGAGCGGSDNEANPEPAMPDAIKGLSDSQREALYDRMNLLSSNAVVFANVLEANSPSWPTTRPEALRMLKTARLDLFGTGSLTAFRADADAQTYAFCVTGDRGDWVLYDRAGGGVVAQSIDDGAPAKCALPDADASASADSSSGSSSDDG